MNMKNFFLAAKKRIVKWLPVILSFLIGILLGWVFGSNWLYYDSESSRGYEIRQGGYRFTNPLLECEVAKDMVESKELRPFRHKVQSLIDDKITSEKVVHISVYFRDLNNGPWFGINEKEKFAPASLLKVPILMSYLKLAESDPQLFAKTIKFEKGYDRNAPENIRPSKWIEAGKTYKIEELLYMMIVYSDNNAQYLLLRNIDMRVFAKPFIDLGLEVPGERTLGDFMTVAGYASFFRILYNASYLSRGMSEKALGYLTEVEFKDGLVAGVPSDVTVTHKFGERRTIEHHGNGDIDMKQLHDCGIIYYPNRPYLLCVMTRGQDFKALADSIRDISHIVFEEVEYQNRK